MSNGARSVAFRSSLFIGWPVPACSFLGQRAGAPCWQHLNRARAWPIVRHALRKETLLEYGATGHSTAKKATQATRSIPPTQHRRLVTIAAAPTLCVRRASALPSRKRRTGFLAFTQFRDQCLKSSLHIVEFRSGHQVLIPLGEDFPDFLLGL